MHLDWALIWAPLIIAECACMRRTAETICLAILCTAMRGGSHCFVWQAALLVLRNNLQPPPHSCLQQEPCVITSSPLPSLPYAWYHCWHRLAQPLLYLCLSLSLSLSAIGELSHQPVCSPASSSAGSRADGEGERRGWDRSRDESEGGKQAWQTAEEGTAIHVSRDGRMADELYSRIFIQKTNCWLSLWGKWATSMNLRLRSGMCQHTGFRKSQWSKHPDSTKGVFSTGLEATWAS